LLLAYAIVLFLDEVYFSLKCLCLCLNFGYLPLQVDYDEAILLWRVDKKDFFLWAITFLATLFLGIEIGVLVGVSTYSSYMTLHYNIKVVHLGLRI